MADDLEARLKWGGGAREAGPCRDAREAGEGGLGRHPTWGKKSEVTSGMNINSYLGTFRSTWVLGPKILPCLKRAQCMMMRGKKAEQIEMNQKSALPSGQIEVNQKSALPSGQFFLAGRRALTKIECGPFWRDLANEA